jgi:nucleotide-binding universal stress UspA family protein
MTRSINAADWPKGTNAAGERRPLRILAPINFHDESHRSRLTALELAANWDAEVTLLHVTSRVPLPTINRTGLDAIELLHSALHSPAGPAASRDDQLSQLRRLEQSALRRMKEAVPPAWCEKVRATFAWRYGDVAEEILNYAETNAFDVIVLGKREHPRPWRFGRGISRRITQKAACQVLIAFPSGQACVEQLDLAGIAS